MNWKIDAALRNFIALLPGKLSYNAHYFLQRRFGALRRLNPTKRFHAALQIIGYIKGQGKSIVDKTFLEVGTGERLNMPIAFWLCGASKIVTVDLNPYLKAKLVLEDIGFIRKHPKRFIELFAEQSEPSIFNERFDKLMSTEVGYDELMNMTGIRYIAPGDAASMDLPDKSIDYHVSYTVLEHINAEVIKQILHEGLRIVSDEGLFVHLIDLSDHFSHKDKTISSIHFLRFNEERWRKLAGNRLAYHNRLRADDFVDLFETMGIDTLVSKTRVDDRSLEQLQNGLGLDEKFRKKTPEAIAVRSLHIVSMIQRKTSSLPE